MAKEQGKKIISDNFSKVNKQRFKKLVEMIEQIEKGEGITIGMIINLPNKNEEGGRAMHFTGSFFSC